MGFRVIFSQHKEFSIEYTGVSNYLSGMLSNIGEIAQYTETTRILPKKRKIGLHILDLYREKVGNHEISIEEVPIIEVNWRNDKYVEVKIDEQTARSSGKFQEQDTFYCQVSLDLMMKFEELTIVGDGKESKLILYIDGDKILGEWIQQEYPEELREPEQGETK